jgi:hypothetical protein
VTAQTGAANRGTGRRTRGARTLPAGIVRAVIRSGRAWMEVGRDLRQLEEHVVHDVGIQLRPGWRSGSHDPERCAVDLPTARERTPNQTRTQKED